MVAIYVLLFLLASASADSLPPAPWLTTGDASVVLLEVPVDVAKSHVPEGFTVEETKKDSGVTQGSLYFAHYTNGTVGPYSECGISVATVSAKGVKGAHEFVMFVDKEIAKEGGEQIWGINKSLATFEYGLGEDWHNISVTSADGKKQVSAQFSWATPALPATTHNDNTLSVGMDPARKGHVLKTTTSQKYGIQFVLKKEVDVPPDSVLGAFISQGAKMTMALHFPKVTTLMNAATDLSGNMVDSILV